MTIEARLEQLSHRHQSLETALHGELQHAGKDESLITELKRQKLRIKDEMKALEEQRMAAAPN